LMILSSAVMPPVMSALLQSVLRLSAVFVALVYYYREFDLSTS
jgi:hypothetical protein